ncbi:MAG: glycoside hydrolase family 3 protein [Treponema sp.]|jgi:beta-N-acetylhexosaminidase|nr:glycoside hydrolase family 3 protein [Treponema sp.]
MRFLPLALTFLLLLSGCFPKTDTADDAPAESESDRAAYYHAADIAAALDDRVLAAQVIISGIDGRGQLPWHMRVLLEECPAGGIMLFRYNLDTDSDAIRRLADESASLVAQGAAAIYPFVAVDHEGGAINRFLSGVADLPPAASYLETAQGRESAIARINTDSFNAGKAINGLGINLNFAPVAEYLNADNGEFLEDRSYGPDPDFTAKAAAAFIMGMEWTGVICAVKHFPGSSGPDPHLFPSVLGGDRAALAELTSPFAALIHDGHARAIMVSHSAVPAWDGETIASLSPQVMGAWLRGELGFKGIIISDDFSMASAGSSDGASPEALAVRSLAAGADMVMVWQPDLRRTHRAILAALGDGRLPRERLQEAATRIIFEKLRMGLVKNGE